MRQAAARLSIALLAAATALAAAWPAGAAADAAQVTVISPGGTQRTLSLEALAGSEDVVERTYALRSPAGERSQTVSGVSLAAILAAAGADPFGFSYLEVQRPGGGSVLLSRQQALSARAFPEGPPVVYATAAGTGFLRPSGGDDDLNAGDSFEAPQGISLVLRKGSALQVRATASPMRTRPGRPVRFSAAVERAGAGERLSYSWYFDDGSSGGDSAEVSHSFRKRGSYDVVVGVTSSGDEAGASAVVTVQVGAPLGGPDRKGGGRNRDAAAPDHGAASGPSAGAPTGEPPGGRTGGSAPHPAAAPATAPPPPPPRPRQPAPVTSPAGQRVSGLLLGPAPRRPAPTRAAKAQAAARAGSPDRGGGGGGVPAAAWGLLASAGLLGAGALLEARGLAGLAPWLARGGAS